MNRDKPLRVVFLERMIPDYRTRLFVLLREKLAAQGIEFVLVTGQMRAGESLRELLPAGEWVKRIHNIYLTEKIHFPIFGDALKGADMVIMHPLNSALGNYRIIARRRLFGRPKIGFFGHGGNAQILKPGQALPVKEKWKRWLAGSPDWWFPYTELSRELLQEVGSDFPEERMTVVNNAIDTTSFARGIDAVSTAAVDRLRRELSLTADNMVGLFCGRLNSIKVNMLPEAATMIHERNPQFRLIIVGKGPEQTSIQNFAAANPWVHYVGPKYDDARFPYFAISHLFLMPGLVGLAILDALAAGLPLLTTKCGVHSPEIAYLEDGVNGLMTAPDAREYANTVLALLDNKTRLLSMSQAARTTGRRVTMEHMADRFVEGICKLFELDRLINPTI